MHRQGQSSGACWVGKTSLPAEATKTEQGQVLCHVFLEALVARPGAWCPHVTRAWLGLSINESREAAVPV